MREQEGRAMMCLDWESSGVVFYGTESSGDFSQLDVMITPCNTRLTTLGADDDRISTQCVENLDEQIKHLGPMNMLIYYNNESFKQDEFGEMRITRQSTIRSIQVDEYRANFIFGKIWKNKLQDEITMV
mmetsp:Transcript_33065/g.40951  ORF Transcript_33065/g.40951 Transcript_33065/m.40951 type:complete len:129 (-) Transcript_33065:1180-1566(-)